MKLTIEDLARFPRPGMAIPGKIAFAPDGKTVTFLWSQKGDLSRELWSLDLATGERSVLFGASDTGAGATDENVSREEALRRERERLRETGITHYEWAEEANVLLVPVRGELFVKKGGETKRVSKGAIDPHLSPKGDSVAFVREGELYVVSLASGEERRLTRDARPGVTNGLAEFVAQEEMGRGRGFWFSPDGKLIAFEQVDETEIPVFRIPHLAKKPGEVEESRYPFAGEANVRWRLGVVSVEGGDVRWLDTSGFEYLARVSWAKDGKLLVQLETRDQKRLELRAYDARTLAATTLLVEESKTWINLHGDLRSLEPAKADGGGEFLWASERSGFKHLYLYKGSQLVRQLTSGEWAVDSVVGVDKESVYFTGTKESPLEKHAYRVSLSGGEPEKITREAGCHEVVVSKDGSSWVDWNESRAQPPGVRVFQRGKPAAIVLHEPKALDFPSPELLSFESRDGVELKGALYKPAKTPAPLIVCVYGGPHAQTVQDSWAQSVDLRAQFLATRGFAVLKVDNRGSARRGLAFEGAIAKKTGAVEVSDQVDGVKHVVSLGVALEGRVGVYGWSYGGYMTLMCLALAPEVFKVGVSGAPVTEWEGYDTHYTERYMETPQSNPGGYRDSSVLTHAKKIAGKLLLVHGMIDENVHFRHTARLIDVLVKAGKAHDLLLFPDERHMPRSEKDRVSLEARIVDYFEKNL